LKVPVKRSRAVVCASLAWSAIATACGPAQKPNAKVRVAVLPAESDAFPQAAQTATASLSKARVAGSNETQISKVSLEVVQLSIECVEPTVDCYQAVGRSLSANRLLFAVIAADGKQLKVTVTLFDVDTRAPKIAQRVFASEQEASAGIPGLVEEATR
jgi:hypothetical protein